MHNNSVEKWIKPGSSNPGIHATTNYGDGDYLWVFSDLARPFQKGRAYDKFAAYTLLRHNGDFAESARELAKRGYGDQRRTQANGKVPDANGSINRSLDDIGNGERFVDQHGASVKWIPERGKFFCWNGVLWEEDVTEQVMIKAHQTARRIFEEAQQCQTC